MNGSLAAIPLTMRLLQLFRIRTVPYGSVRLYGSAPPILSIGDQAAFFLVFSSSKKETGAHKRIKHKHGKHLAFAVSPGNMRATFTSLPASLYLGILREIGDLRHLALVAMSSAAIGPIASRTIIEMTLHGLDSSEGRDKVRL